MAAGLGYIEFATGDILTAAAANGYLASQVVMVFADAAARTSAIASPQEGMMSYLKDTNSTEYYSGSAWVAIGGGGSSGALTYLGGASFTSAASQSIDSVFSSTYQNYLVMLNVYSGDGTLALNFRSSGSDNTTANYNFYNDYMAFGSTWSRAISNVSNATSMTLNQGMSASNLNIPLTIMNPQLAQKTQVLSPMVAYNYGGSTNYSSLNTGFFNATTQFDGIKFTAGTGMTGTLKIYGIANS